MHFVTESNIKDTLMYKDNLDWIVHPMWYFFSLRILYSSLIQLANTTPSETRYLWQMESK